MTDIDYYFDPACPWTWLTSRWLVDAADQRGLEVGWRPLSLMALNGDDVPEAYVGRLRVAARAHRVFAALLDDGRNDLVGAVYSAIGERTHDAGATLDDGLLRAAVAAAGAQGWAAAIDEPAWDGPVEVSTKKAVELAGPDVGSPVLAVGTPRVGLFGPIVNPGPRGAEGGRLLDLTIELAGLSGFHELKRGRDAGPRLPAPPWR